VIIKKNNKLNLLRDRLEILLPQVSNRDLQAFLLSLSALTKGNAKEAQLLVKDINSEKLKGIIESLMEYPAQ